mmetsp:Transcript_4471/g.12524  ORF Transcript_4471/g.12524 Transcript_4471/m.12524 type:complete len:191 (+) Transcript_4471:80-652(+)
MDKARRMGLDRPLRKPKQEEVSLSIFAFLFSEFVQYSQSRVATFAELDKRLVEAGKGVGYRVLELSGYREKISRRETKVVSILSFIHSTIWKSLFGKAADSLEKSTEHDDEYMIIDNDMLVNKYISVPKDLGNLTCAAYVAGIVFGILDGAEFTPEKVSAHSINVEGQPYPKTVILIKFKPDIIERDNAL